jgi:hypothetical protein
MSMDGSFVVIGWQLYDDDGNNNNTNIGVVEVYRYVQASLSWQRQGNSIFGKASGDFFGASLSLSEDGSSLAVGAAGNGGYAEVYLLNSDAWARLGETVASSVEELDVYSVSLSNDGTTLAVGGVPATEDGAVAKIYHWIAGLWEERGSGIDGQTDIGETIYLAYLSADGDTVVVSNYYTAEAKANTGEALDVRAFVWSDDADDWEPLGQNMHAGCVQEKSGYFISISQDGRTIAMGDPEARVEGQGAGTGHAHFFAYMDGEWLLWWWWCLWFLLWYLWLCLLGF